MAQAKQGRQIRSPVEEVVSHVLGELDDAEEQLWELEEWVPHHPE